MNDNISNGALNCDGVNPDSFYKNYDIKLNITNIQHFDDDVVSENLYNISLYDHFKSITNECFESLKSIQGKFIDSYFSSLLNDIYNNGIMRHYYDFSPIPLHHSSKGTINDYSTIYEYIRILNLYITSNKNYKFEYKFELC